MNHKIYYQKYFYLLAVFGMLLPFALPLHLTAQSTGSWQTVNPASGSIIGREENSYAQAGGKFYLLGGRGIVSAQEYNPATRTWINKAKPPIELNHFQGVTLNGLIYCVGAMNGPYPDEVPLANVYTYNPTTNTWGTGSSIPSARRRGAAGAVVYKNKIYVVGGITHGHVSGWVSWFDEYDPATGTWKTMPDAPRTRDHFQAVVINDKLYVAGGRNSAYPNTFNATIGEVDVYDFITGKWSALPNNLPVPRAGAANIVLGNEVIVIGGESNLQTLAHKETHALNVTTNTWRKLADLQTGTHGTGAVVYNGEIYIAAGAGQRGGTPKVLTQQKFSMSAPTSIQVSDFTLINTSTKTETKLTNGYSITLASSGNNYNIRANTSPSTVGSVKFKLLLNGTVVKTQTESSAPYALYGDNSGVYNPWTPAAGNYTLSATPYSASGGSGTAGPTLTINFTVTAPATVAARQLQKTSEQQLIKQNIFSNIKAYPNPATSGEFTLILPQEIQGDVHFSLLSLSGNKVTDGALSLKKPTSKLTFDFSHQMLVSGNYYLHLETKDQKGYVQLMHLNK